MMSSFNARPALPIEVFPELAGSDRNVLNQMAQGASKEVSARRLSFSGKTVRNYVSNIFSQFQVADRAQARVKAQEAGLQLFAMHVSAGRRFLLVLQFDQ